MKLSVKTLLIVGALFIGLIGVIYAVSGLIVLSSFDAVEEEAAQQNAEQSVYLLVSDINLLDSVAYEWSRRDELVSYVTGESGKSPDIIEDRVFDQLGISYLILADESGGVLSAREYNFTTRVSSPLSRSAENEFISSDSFLVDVTQGTPVTGVLLLQNNPVMLSSYPVMGHGGKIEGSLTMARVIDEVEMARISSLTFLPLEMEIYSGAGEGAGALFSEPGYLTGDFLSHNANDVIVIDAPVRVGTLSEEEISGYSLIRDVYGDPAIILSVTMPRAIAAEGRATVTYFIGWILIVGVIFGALILLLLERTVLSRLSFLTTRMTAIGSRKDFSARVPEEGDDEIGAMACTFNNMLSRLEDSQNQLQGKLSATEERYKLFFNSGNDVVMVAEVGADGLPGKLIEVNDEACRLFHTSREDMLGLEQGEFEVGGTGPDGTERMLHLNANGHLLYETFFRGAAEGDDEIPVEVNAHLFSHEGQQGVVSIARDITERREMERLKGEAFNQIEKNMEQFAILNDHLRNPLQAIVGLALLSIEDEETMNKLLSQVELINSYVDQLDRGWIESEKIRDWLRRYYKFE